MIHQQWIWRIILIKNDTDKSGYCIVKIKSVYNLQEGGHLQTINEHMKQSFRTTINDKKRTKDILNNWLNFFTLFEYSVSTIRFKDKKKSIEETSRIKRA